MRTEDGSVLLFDYYFGSGGCHSEPLGGKIILRYRNDFILRERLGLRKDVEDVWLVR